MWDTIFTAMIGFGGVWSWKASSARTTNQQSRGIDAAAPISELPRSLGQDDLSAAIASRWRTNLVVGLALVAAGITGTVLRVLDDVSVSREEFIETVSSAPDNTSNRDELSCLFDIFEAGGIDIGSTTKDEVVAGMADAFGRMSESELVSVEACFDERTTAERQAQLDAMSDAHIRDFLIGAMVADPTTGVTRRDAECIVGYLDQQGVLRELFSAEGTFSPELGAIQDAAELACI